MHLLPIFYLNPAPFHLQYERLIAQFLQPLHIHNFRSLDRPHIALTGAINSRTAIAFERIFEFGLAIWNEFESNFRVQFQLLGEATVAAVDDAAID